LRELPVLFHLMDVSRPKGYATAGPLAFKLDATDDGLFAASPPPSSQPGRATHASGLVSELLSAPPNCAAESFDLETAAELVQTKAYGSLPSEAPKLDIPSEAPADSPSPSLTMHSSEVPAGEGEAVFGLDTPAPTGVSAVTLRERAEERKRKRKEGKKDDWFGTQGRYIAIGFFVALAVTIYVARNSRKSAAPPVAAKRQAPATEVAGAAKKSTSPVKQATAVEAAKITSIRPTAKSGTASEPKTALHPPTIPQLSSEPSSASSAADATLFTFSKRTDERVAARNDEPAAASTGTASGPTETTRPMTSPTPTSTATPTGTAPPTLEPHYPSTNYPSQYQPAASDPRSAPPGGVYAPPTPNYAPPLPTYAPPAAAYAPPPATYAPPPATYAPPSAPAGPALGPAASTMPLYPTTNTASGYRYERTGSSVY
jgi:hypothetical protein